MHALLSNYLALTHTHNTHTPTHTPVHPHIPTPTHVRTQLSYRPLTPVSPATGVGATSYRYHQAAGSPVTQGRQSSVPAWPCNETPLASQTPENQHPTDRINSFNHTCPCIRKHPPPHCFPTHTSTQINTDNTTDIPLYGTA
jgi:hypothetical protein